MDDKTDILATLQDPEFQHHVFQEFMKLYIIPEIEKRQAAGALPIPFILTEYQVLLPPNSEPVVRLNADETKFRVTVQLTENNENKTIEALTDEDIVAVGNFELSSTLHSQAA